MTQSLSDLPGSRGPANQWLGWLLLLPLPVIVFAAWQYGLFGNVSSSYPRMLFVVVAVVAVIAVAVRTVWRFFGKQLGIAVVPTMIALLVAAGFGYFAGAAATLSATLLALSALGIGTCFDRDQPTSASVRMLVGLAVIAAAVGWLLPFPVHYGRFYIVLLVGVVLLRRVAIRRELGEAVATWRELAMAHPGWLTLAAAAAGVASLGLWLPSMNFDDNAAHLILPDQLLTDGYYRLDVSSQVWAVAPWANNVLHGLAALVAGNEARASVNVLWLLIGIAGAYRLAIAVGSKRTTALAAAAVFASHPLTAYYGSCMQVDGAVAAVLLHFSADLAQAKGRISAAWTTGALLGLLAGLKSSNVLYVFLPLLWLAWSALEHREPGRLFRMVAMAAVIGGSSYFYAVIVTGNPIFPLFNGIFKSPYFLLQNFHDHRWDTGVNWRSLWDLTFDTGRFGECYPGAAGIALLAVLPGFCLELLQPRSGRWIGLWLLAAGALMFWQIQYLRYVFPAIAVLTCLGLSGMSRYIDQRRLAWFVVAVVAVNAVLMPSTSWTTISNPWRKLLAKGSSAKTDIEREFIPERAVLERLRVNSPAACVLASEAQIPFVGGFNGRANAMSAFDPQLSQANASAEADISGNQWRQVLMTVGASHIVLRQPDLPLTNALGMMGYVATDAEGPVEVWASAIPEQRRCNRQLQQQRDQAVRLFRFGRHHG